MLRSIWGYGATLLAAFTLVACVASSTVSAPETPTDSLGATVVSHGGPVRDQVSLVGVLHAQGLSVKPVGEVQQPFLRAKGTRLKLTGPGIGQPAEVQSYNYDDAELGADGTEAARADADAIGPDGSPRTMMISWTGTPHFFGTERVIVIYVGEDEAVLRQLTDALGPRFAGG